MHIGMMLHSSIALNFKNTSDTTTKLILENTPTFSCQTAATLTFLNLYLYPWIYQELQFEGKYNVTTEMCEEEDYDDYEDDYEDEDKEEEVVEETSSPTSATSSTPTSSPTSTTSPPTNDPIPIDLRKPLFQFHTIKPPSRPYGDMCRFKHLYGLYPELNNTKYSIICVADVPNLPVYGALSYWNTYRHDHWIRNMSFPPVPTWLKMLPLGMKQYRLPIILTDPLPQSWATIDSGLPNRNLPDLPFLKGQSYFCALMNILQPYTSTNNSLTHIPFNNTYLNGTTHVEASVNLLLFAPLMLPPLAIQLPLPILLLQIGLVSIIT
jgi:hypothetical protein